MKRLALYLTYLQFEYRLSVCPELSLGVFCTVVPSIAEEKGFQIDTLATAKKVETARPNGAKSVLFAHIVATKTDGQTVTDRDMDYPRDWKTRRANATDVGHKEAGRTICLHSLAVHPKLQGCNLGKMLMKAYLQQVKNSGLADRISLIAQKVSLHYAVHFSVIISSNFWRTGFGQVLCQARLPRPRPK